MKNFILLFSLAWATNGLAHQSVIVNWPASAASNSYVSANGQVHISVLSPQVITGNTANHSVFSCYANNLTTATCNMQVLNEILNQPTEAQVQVTTSRVPCHGYLCDMDWTQTTEAMTLTFPNGLVMASQVRIRTN